MKKIAVFMKLGNEQKEKIVRAAEKYGYRVDFYRDQREYLSNEDVEIIIGNTADQIEKSKNLKWMHLHFAGVSDEILKKLPETCLLTNSSGAYGITIAEHMIMQTLMILRGMPVFFKSSVRHGWHKPIGQTSIKDARITVLGAGDIGTSYAKRIKAFEPKQIVAVNRSGISKEDIYDQVYPISKLEEVLPHTDILAMSIPGASETDKIINAHTLSLMPKGSYIINVGRGNSVDEKALMEALNLDHLAGAALDVFEQEPLKKDSVLWDTKNLIITPHIAGPHTEIHANRMIVDIFCENLENYELNKPLKNIVNRKLGY